MAKSLIAYMMTDNLLMALKMRLLTKVMHTLEQANHIICRDLTSGQCNQLIYSVEANSSLCSRIKTL